MIREGVNILTSLTKQARMGVEFALKVTMIGRGRAGMLDFSPSAPCSWALRVPAPQAAPPSTFHLVLLSTQLFNRLFSFFFFFKSPLTSYLASCPAHFTAETYPKSVLCSPSPLRASPSKAAPPLTWTRATAAHLASASTSTSHGLFSIEQPGDFPKTHNKFNSFPAQKLLIALWINSKKSSPQPLMHKAPHDLISACLWLPPPPSLNFSSISFCVPHLPLSPTISHLLHVTQPRSAFSLLLEYTKLTAVLYSFTTWSALSPVLPLALSHHPSLPLKTASLKKPFLSSTLSEGDPVTLCHAALCTSSWYLLCLLSILIH